MALRQWPLPEGTFQISSRFAGRINPVTGAPENHSGTDMAAPDGTPFYACAGGTIQYLGAATGYGRWIVIDHPDSEGGGCSEYGHMWSDLQGLAVGQWVDRGQIIGHVGANGQSTGPHLHLTVWEREYGGTRIDPETWLDGAPYPPTGGGRAGDTASSTGGQGMTIFGVDVSEHQDGMSLAQAKREGIGFAFIRTTDGTYRDRCYRSHLEDAESSGMVTAAYHFCRRPDEGTSVAAQVDASVAVMGDAVRPVWLDVETPGGFSGALVAEFKAEFERRGVRVAGVYSYVPYWEGQMGAEPDSHPFGPFWVAGYPSAAGGTPQQIYTAVRGDSASQWAHPLGNQLPALWQFTDRATVAGHQVDANAFRWSAEDLRALIYGGQTATTASEEDDMFTDDDRAALLDCRAMLQTLCAQDMGDPGVTGPYGGWPHEQIMKTVREKLAAGKDLTRTEQLHALADTAGIYKEK